MLTKQNLLTYDKWISNVGEKKKKCEITTSNIVRPSDFYCIELVEHWFFNPKDYKGIPKTNDYIENYYPEMIFKCFTQIKDMARILEGLIVKVVNNYYVCSDNFYEIRVFYPRTFSTADCHLTTNNLNHSFFLRPNQNISNPRKFVDDLQKEIRAAMREGLTKNEFRQVYSDYRKKI